MVVGLKTWKVLTVSVIEICVFYSFLGNGFLQNFWIVTCSLGLGFGRLDDIVWRVIICVVVGLSWLSVCERIFPFLFVACVRVFMFLLFSNGNFVRICFGQDLYLCALMFVCSSICLVFIRGVSFFSCDFRFGAFHVFWGYFGS